MTTPADMEAGYRKLAPTDIDILKANGCSAADWSTIEIADGLNLKYLRHSRFSGYVRIGRCDTVFTMAGGIRKHSGIYHATLHNVTVGDNCCLENIKNYIANYDIGSDTFIENVDILLVDGPTTFGNGVEVSVLNETGGREVTIHNRLSAHEAYIEAMYRHHPGIVAALKRMARDYAETLRSDRGRIGNHVTIVDAGYIKNVAIGDYCKIEGAGRLRNGTINSNSLAPVHIGYGVVLDDFIVQSNSSIEDGSMLTRCYVGQNCRMGHTYSASDSLFFSNCQGENGEACAIFAGPFTVTHHKSTLLIAGMFSFMNAGSGSNQSNHMYKLGPIHQGSLERGAKTTSDSYILWPARIGAFSLVMGRHVGNVDTTDLPFSYLIEQQGMSILVPGINLRSVGTIRDVQKWPKRDNRPDPDRFDQINYNLLSPYTMQKALRGIDILQRLKEASGPTSESYTFFSAKIKGSALRRGIHLYRTAVIKFLGNSVIHRLMTHEFIDVEGMRRALRPDCQAGHGEWVDISGLIAPKQEVERLIDDIHTGAISSIDALNSRFAALHASYYDMEWTWAYDKMLSYFNLDIDTITVHDILDIVDRWLEAVVNLDQMVYDNAKKEFSLSAKTGFGVDGSRFDMERDFEMVRGDFENNSFVRAVKDHIAKKTDLAQRMKAKLNGIAE